MHAEQSNTAYFVLIVLGNWYYFVKYLGLIHHIFHL